MTKIPDTIVNRVALVQIMLYFTCAPLLLISQKTSYLLIGWGVVLVANSGMFLVASLQKPSLRALVSGEIFKYSLFTSLLYASIKLQPYAWPYALYGILMGHISYIIACMLIGRHHA